MMTQEQAAKYFVVAWVRGWSLRNYLNVVADGTGRIEWNDAHAAYKWLPKDVGIFIRNTTVRRYIADAFGDLNNRLWDAADNASRLKLANLIAKCSGAKVKTHTDKARVEDRKQAKKYKDEMMVNRISINKMRLGSGHHWSVVK